MPLDKLILEKRSEILTLARRHGAANIRVFGSAATGDFKPGSDIDFLVELEPGRSLFSLGALWVDLQALLGCKVDVVTPNALHWYIREKVLAESLPL